MNLKIYLCFVLLICSCKVGNTDQSNSETQPTPITLINTNASEATKALAVNLQQLAKTHILFGHADANFYGHNWKDEIDRSDVKDVCGSHPAVYGADLGGITNQKNEQIRLKEEHKLRKHIVDAYSRGGVNTLAWHFSNPINEGSFYYKENPIAAVPQIIPGGVNHQKYKEKLDIIAQFAHSLRHNGELIPVIFRPFHEYDGDWFWWGTPHHCTKEEFLSLWRFTVTYLCEVAGVTNFIFACSPDCKFNTKEELLAYYPGDEYVDLIGMDNYWDFRPDGGSLTQFANKMRIVADLAKERNKLCALTETGLEGIPNPEWWTKVLLSQLKDQNFDLAYVLVWRNAYQDPNHFYAPFPGHPSCANFIEFYNDPYTLFQNDLKNLYTFNSIK